jgi:hypothetical protein
VVNRRVVWLAVLAAGGLLAVLFCAIWVIPRLPYPPLGTAALGADSREDRQQL